MHIGWLTLSTFYRENNRASGYNLMSFSVWSILFLLLNNWLCSTASRRNEAKELGSGGYMQWNTVLLDLSFSHSGYFATARFFFNLIKYILFSWEVRLQRLVCVRLLFNVNLCAQDLMKWNTAVEHRNAEHHLWSMTYG